MPVLIQTIDEYFYSRKRDILVLEMRIKQPDNKFMIDRKLCELESTNQLLWFKTRGIDYYMTVDASVLEGWFGHYYIDIDPSDPCVNEYSNTYEDPNGISLDPEKYQMITLKYNEWVNKGSLIKHEQHLINQQDPDWMP